MGPINTILVPVLHQLLVQTEKTSMYFLTIESNIRKIKYGSYKHAALDLLALRTVGKDVEKERLINSQKY